MSAPSENGPCIKRYIRTLLYGYIFHNYNGKKMCQTLFHASANANIDSCVPAGHCHCCYCGMYLVWTVSCKTYHYTFVWVCQTGVWLFQTFLTGCYPRRVLANYIACHGFNLTNVWESKRSWYFHTPKVCHLHGFERKWMIFTKRGATVSLSCQPSASPSGQDVDQPRWFLRQSI